MKRYGCLVLVAVAFLAAMGICLGMLVGAP